MLTGAHTGAHTPRQASLPFPLFPIKASPQGPVSAPASSSDPSQDSLCKSALRQWEPCLGCLDGNPGGHAPTPSPGQAVDLAAAPTVPLGGWPPSTHTGPHSLTARRPGSPACPQSLTPPLSPGSCPWTPASDSTVPSAGPLCPEQPRVSSPLRRLGLGSPPTPLLLLQPRQSVLLVTRTASACVPLTTHPQPQNRQLLASSGFSTITGEGSLGAGTSQPSNTGLRVPRPSSPS